jgi:hypothetical protein
VYARRISAAYIKFDHFLLAGGSVLGPQTDCMAHDVREPTVCTENPSVTALSGIGEHPLPNTQLHPNSSKMSIH